MLIVKKYQGNIVSRVKRSSLFRPSKILKTVCGRSTTLIGTLHTRAPWPML